MAAPDAKLDLAERERLRQEQPGSDLDRRLARLPDGHPSSSGYEDVAAPRGTGDETREPERIKPLTDAEYAEHLAEVETKLDEARATGLMTNRMFTTDQSKTVWSYERRLLHDEIIETAYAASAAVPCEAKAILVGGLSGAGKTTVLRDDAGIDLSKYVVLNPDVIKEEMARRGLIPEVDSLSPLEASDLVHEESSHVARRLGHRAQADGKNVIWDVTMGRAESVQARIDDLRAAGYTRIEGIFVDISIEASLRRAESRHRQGLEDYRAGIGFGGRYVPAELIKSHADAEWGTQNRRNFESIKERLDTWCRYDNSVDGRAALVAEAQASDQAHVRRADS